jgi:hypothetical protein
VGTTVPRGTESALPGRVSAVWNVTTPPGSGRQPGKPTVREAQLPGGHRMVQQANAGGRKATGNRDAWLFPSAAVSHNWPDTGACLARKGADVDQVSH